MALPTVLPSERSFSPQTVCVPLSCFYLARYFKPEIPATKDEAIALMAAAGVTDWYTVGRFNFTKLAAGMKARYGLIGTVVEGMAAAQAAAKAAAAAGPCAIGYAGNQANLVPSWQPGNNIGHAIAVIYQPGAGTTGIQLDPLAPAGYAGDSFPLTEMAKFATAAIIFTGAPKETDVPSPLKTYAPALISLGGSPLIDGLVPIREAPSATAPIAYKLTPGQGYLTTIGTVGTTASEWYAYWDVPKGKWLYVALSNVPIRTPLVDAAGQFNAGVDAASAAAQTAKK
jgi:hypothetical protein